jgi:outer membrane protein
MVVFILWAITLSGLAQTTTRILTFEEAIKLAMQNSILINQQKNNLALSQVQKLSSIASIGPNVQINGQAFQVNGNSFNNQTGKTINGVRDAVTGSISANMNIFSGFYRINSIKQFANQLEAQSYLVNRTSQDVMNTVSTQYLQVMLDVELVKIAKENFEALEKQLQQVKEHVILGSRSPVDEYNQDALTKAAELRFVQAEINLNNDKSLLSQTLLIDPFEEFEVEKPNWDVNSIGAEKLDVQEMSARAKQFRSDYLRALKNETAAKYGMKAARGLMMPSVSAFANYGSAYNFQHGVPTTIDSAGIMIQNREYPRPFKEQFQKNNVYKSYGLQLTIPIFNGLQNQAALAQQRVFYQNSQLERKGIEYQINNDVIRAVRNYEGARKAYAVSTDQLKAAATAFEYETERFNLGVTSFVDYTNANRVFIQAQTDMAQAEFRFVFQKILLEYAVGTLKQEGL